MTAPKSQAHAVLIRAIEPVDNIQQMLLRRNQRQLKPQLTAGPGVMSKALGITTAYTGLTLVQRDSLIWIEDRGVQVPEKEIIASPRVGVDYAGECAFWNWRFRIKGSKWTSKAK